MAADKKLSLPADFIIINEHHEWSSLDPFEKEHWMLNEYETHEGNN